MDKALLIRVCHYAMSETSRVAGADVFLDGNDAHTAYHVHSGRLRYHSVFNSEEPEVVIPGDWVAEVTLWVQWVYRGHLCAATMCEMTVLDERAFHSVMTQQCSQAVDSMRRFAVFLLSYGQELQDQGVPITDLPLDQEALKGLVLQASRMTSMKLQGWCGLFR